jgi:hypothetical protein
MRFGDPVVGDRRRNRLAVGYPPYVFAYLTRPPNVIFMTAGSIAAISNGYIQNEKLHAIFNVCDDQEKNLPTARQVTVHTQSLANNCNTTSSNLTHSTASKQHLSQTRGNVHIRTF